MKKLEPVPYWKEGEYAYPMALGFSPDMTPYIHEDDMVHPCMIVVPGGGYAMVSPTEGELVALKFYEAGYQAFVASYTTNLLCSVPLNDQPLRDICRAIRLVRANAEKFKVDPNRIAICGFSAGGNLCGNVSVHALEVTDPDPALNEISARPNAAILSYPVITSGDYAHQDSFRCLLGADVYERQDAEAKRLLDYYSVEKNVTDRTPPCFLWQTVTDETVPVENSVLMAKALKTKGIPFALHLFSDGRHGLSTADEKWGNLQFGDDHCADQFNRTLEAVRSGTIPVPEEQKKSFLAFPATPMQPEPANTEVSVWPSLAMEWLEKTLGKNA